MKRGSGYELASRVVGHHLGEHGLNSSYRVVNDSHRLNDSYRVSSPRVSRIVRAADTHHLGDTHLTTHGARLSSGHRVSSPRVSRVISTGHGHGGVITTGHGHHEGTRVIRDAVAHDVSSRIVSSGHHHDGATRIVSSGHHGHHSPARTTVRLDGGTVQRITGVDG